MSSPQISDVDSLTSEDAFTTPALAVARPVTDDDPRTVDAIKHLNAAIEQHAKDLSEIRLAQVDKDNKIDDERPVNRQLCDLTLSLFEVVKHQSELLAEIGTVQAEAAKKHDEQEALAGQARDEVARFSTLVDQIKAKQAATDLAQARMDNSASRLVHEANELKEAQNKLEAVHKANNAAGAEEARQKESIHHRIDMLEADLLNLTAHTDITYGHLGHRISVDHTRIDKTHLKLVISFIKTQCEVAIDMAAAESARDHIARMRGTNNPQRDMSRAFRESTVQTISQHAWYWCNLIVRWLDPNYVESDEIVLAQSEVRQIAAELAAPLGYESERMLRHPVTGHVRRVLEKSAKQAVEALCEVSGVELSAPFGAHVPAPATYAPAPTAAPAAQAAPAPTHAPPPANDDQAPPPYAVNRLPYSPRTLARIQARLDAGYAREEADLAAREAAATVEAEEADADFTPYWTHFADAYGGVGMFMTPPHGRHMYM